MLLDIRPVSDKNYTCLECVYATFLSWKNSGCNMLFAGSWSFYLEETSDIFGTRLSSDRAGSWRNQLQDQYMEQYYGVKVVWYDINHFHELIQIVDANLEASLPTCICLDSFWCSWVPSYQTYDTPHYFLIAGKHEETGNYLCVDPQYPEKIHELTLHHFEKGFYEEERLKQEYGEVLVDGFGECASFIASHSGVEKIVIPELLEKALQAVLEGSHGKSDFWYMRTFANQLGQLDSMQSELQKLPDVDHHHSWIFRRMEHIGWGRLNFSRMLKGLYLKRPSNELMHLIEQFEEASRKWETINFMLLKACYLKNASPLLRKIAGNILNTADYEEQIAEEMKSIIGKLKGSDMDASVK
ncbi:hypothetical protein ACQKLN_30385 [Paenibacillus glucanolyticus]|uniref:hypothetical protein n=1 Tax=Paenibacillus glucanolyticus TaxID=59843 RepID=UPI0036ADFE4A